MKTMNVFLDLSYFSDFEILSTENDEVFLDLEEEAEEYLDIEIDDDSLTLNINDKKNLRHYFDGKLFVGKDVFCHLFTICNETSNVEIENIKAGILNITNDRGDFTIQNVQLDTIEMATHTGCLMLENSNLKNMVLSSKSGSIRLKNINAFEIQVSTISGYIELDDLKAFSGSIYTVSGKINNNDTELYHHIHCHTAKKNA